MDSNILRTSVDDLYELVKSKGKISIEDAAKELKLPSKVVQNIVDYLVEEKIFGIEYKFTTPFIYVSGEKENISVEKDSENPLLTKEDFFKKAQQRGLPSEKIHTLWTKYLEENIAMIKERFYERSYKKNLTKAQVDILWNKYLMHIR